MQHTVEKLCGRLDDQAKEKLAFLNGKVCLASCMVKGHSCIILLYGKKSSLVQTSMYQCSDNLLDQRHHLKKQALEIATQSHELEKIV